MFLIRKKSYFWCVTYTGAPVAGIGSLIESAESDVSFKIGIAFKNKKVIVLLLLVLMSYFAYRIGHTTITGTRFKQAEAHGHPVVQLYIGSLDFDIALELRRSFNKHARRISFPRVQAGHGQFDYKIGSGADRVGRWGGEGKSTGFVGDTDKPRAVNPGLDTNEWLL